MRFLGVDIGTYQSKACMTDGAGRVLAQAVRAHEMRVPRAGWAEHDAEADWWGECASLTREVVGAAGAPDAVAVSGIGPCMLPVDAEGRALMPAVLYGVDTRAGTEIEELTEEIGEGTLLARCGNALTSQSVGPKILWLRRNRPEIWARTDRIHTCSTFLVRRLTGETVIDHYTAAGFTPLYDVERQDWAPLAEICPVEMLPRLLWSSEIAGRVTDDAARETGLVPGTPVTAGTIDAAAEAVSVGTRGVGDTMIMYGSTVFIIAVTGARTTDPRLWYAPWLFPGEHAAMGGAATSGTLTHWFREELARELGDDGFERLAAEAASVPPGARGLIALPYFSGERTPIHDLHAKGAFFGLNLTHGRPEMMRALLEGIAMGTAHAFEAFAEAGAGPGRLLAVGGGTQNEVWLRATSDLTGLPQELRRVTVGASYGDAFLAALTVGAVEREEIDAWNPAERVVEPERHEAYARQYPLFKELYAATKGIMRGLG